MTSTDTVTATRRPEPDADGGIPACQRQSCRLTVRAVCPAVFVKCFIGRDGSVSTQSAATAWPAGPWSGTATQHTPELSSWSSNAAPRFRMLAASRRQLADCGSNRPCGLAFAVRTFPAAVDDGQITPGRILTLSSTSPETAATTSVRPSDRTQTPTVAPVARDSA